MPIKIARSVSERTQRSVYDRLRGGTVNVVCAYWLSGRCSRNPCRFLHTESLPSQPPKQSQYRNSKTWQRSPSNSIKNSSISPSIGVGSETWQSSPNNAVNNSSISPSRGVGSETLQMSPNNDVKNSSVSPSRAVPSEHRTTKRTQEKVCEYWLSGNCVHGEKCEYLHSWFCGNGFSMLAKLEGHTKAITGIALPSGSDKLYSGGKDKTMRVWDCNSGQCVGVVNLLGEVGSLVSEGPWVFVGLRNAVKAWNTQDMTELTLTGPVGQVYAMEVGNDMLFAGTQDGTILAWKSSSETNCPELAASLKGHSSCVVSLIVGAGRLYSGSMDHTIRVWDLTTLKCIHTLNGHTDVVMSVLCWDSYLFSCSLDGTIKVWACTKGGDLEVTYTHKVKHGVLALHGIHDVEAKPILFCSCNDNSVRLYDLPSFAERGRLFAKQEVRAIQIGPAGLFFTGDAMGQLMVWKLAGELSAVTS